MAKKSYVFTFEEVVFLARLVQFFPMPDPEAEQGKSWRQMVWLSELFEETVKGVRDKGNGKQAVELSLFGWGAKTLSNLLKHPFGVSNGQAIPLSWPANQARLVAGMLFKLTGETVGEWADEEDDDELIPLKEKN